MARRLGIGNDVDVPFGVELDNLLGEGLRIVPCKLGTKKPRIPDWPRQASSSPAVVREWARRFGETNWAVATGRESGVFVVDVDGEEGKRSLTALEERFGRLPDTRRVKTGNGVHVYFRCPPNATVRSNTARLGIGLDVRGEGGCAIVPPSMHTSGRRYTWLNPDYPFALPPAWLIERMAENERFGVAAPAEKSFRIADGRRNDSLFRRGSSLRRRGADCDEIAATLLRFNDAHCDSPLESPEVLRIAKSASRYEKGGPDPLEVALQRALEMSALTKGHNRILFVELCRQLQLARRDQPIIVPLVRIADLLGVHYSSVHRWRKEAQKEGLLVFVKDSVIPHKAAGEFWFRWHAYREWLEKVTIDPE